MPANDFESQLSQALNFTGRGTDPYSQTYESVKQIAEAIQNSMNSNPAEPQIRVELEPGFRATIGQQLRVILRIPSKSFRDTLFRAYIPMDGWPVFLDIGGEEPVRCRDLEELQHGVLDFLTRIRDRMMSYREYAEAA